FYVSKLLLKNEITMRKTNNNLYRQISVKFLVLVWSTLSFVSCNHARDMRDIVFEGTISGHVQGHNTIMMYNHIAEESDTATVTDGRFAMKIPFSVPTRYMLFLEYEYEVKGGYVPFGILVDGPGKIAIDANAEKGLYKAEVKGSE